MKRSHRTGVPHYSYRQKDTESKTVYKRLAIISGLIIVLLVAIWFWGVTFINIIGALGSNEQEETTVTSLQIPLQKPAFNDLPEFTNNVTITISGSTSTGARLTLILNGTESGKTLADVSGKFSFVDVPLKEGRNLIKVIASDASGETQEQRALITLDKTKPKLDISSPSNGQKFPNTTQTITVKGSTEPNALVLVNSIQAIVNQNGDFSYTLSVSAGKSDIEVKATDEAGNSDVKKLTITVEK